MSARRRVLITGLPYFTKRIAALLDDREWCSRIVVQNASPTPLHKRAYHAQLLLGVPMCDVVYQIGGPFLEDRVITAAKIFGRPVVLHWVGSDAARAREEARVRQQDKSSIVHHWADAPWLVEELAQAGVSAVVVPSCGVTLRPASPLPAGALTVLAYLPDSRWDFYGGRLIEELARELPDVNFLVAANEGHGRSLSANVTFLGWRSTMDEIYERCHALVRMPEHDGLSSMVIEALAAGRHVVWNHRMPGCLYALTADDMRARVLELRQLQQAGRLSLNHAGKEYADSEFAVATVAEKMHTRFESILTSRSPTTAMVHRARN
ncbi:MAG: hypothetical protein DLM53_03215 [Candidatus Eremiobacter antarcticus]|nr:glycosyltransferase [Candidatus Eremiobacteraeota bacterium]MBC5808424.1 glycosyltransferase [Candidatus Eremiobacteraeota bacterium]PZR63782.1 MAG: hypothetical protein DLM53_03215 [Candidatus Eremiobacter sp. RRmetagenome_bin22]